MGKGSSQPSTTTQIQKVELPAWVDKASQANYNSATAISNKPYQAYTGDRVAELSPLEQAASGTLQNGMNTSNSALQMALASAGAAGGYTPQNVTAQNVTAGSVLDGGIQKYMDPNLDAVVNTTLSGMDRGIASAAQTTADQARGAGAWGGSRFGVQQGVLAAEGVRNKAATEASLRSNAFDKATALASGDRQSALQAALANQGAGLSAATANQNAGIAGAGLGLQAGALANTVGQTASDTAGRNSILQQQLGAAGRGIDQAKLDQNYSSWEDAQNYDTEALNLRLAALGMSPYGKTTTGTTTQPSQSSSNGLLTGIGAAASILPLLFSDKRVKKNIKKKGTMPGTDLPAYEFEYKKPIGIGGKQFGLMAQDVEKKTPEAVHNVKGPNGKTVKAVDYPLAILEGAKRKSRKDKGHIRAPYKPQRAA